ncbi:MAG: radical SAM protein [Geobacter sp.]|nr:radical SAM protein [Geobacter sp.]
MKILLIQPRSSSDLMDQIYLFEPLALEYLAAGAQLDGHEVKILDARIDGDIDGAVRAFRPDVVGLTGFTSHVNIIKAIASQVKEIDEEITVIVGGHHATVRPDDFNDQKIDFVVIGEGVFTLRELLAVMEGRMQLRLVRGIAVPYPEGMLFTEPRAYTALDELPLPDRSLTACYRRSYFSEWFKPLASIRTSLGCTARCNFCALWNITGGRYLRRDPELVVAELKGIAEENVFFCDDESMCDTQRMDRLADLIAEAGIRKNFFLYARVDTIINHPELFAKWREIGLCQLFVGMEDFSDARLKAMKKGVTVAQQQEAARILDQLGIMMYASFMVDPDYSREDFVSMRNYVRKLKLKYATFTVMTPLPGTELHETVKERLLSSKPELYDMLHALTPPRLPLQEFYREMAKLYKGAVPVYRSLPAMLQFGLHGLFLRIKLFGEFLKRVERFHLDY